MSNAGELLPTPEGVNAWRVVPPSGNAYRSMGPKHAAAIVAFNSVVHGADQGEWASVHASDDHPSEIIEGRLFLSDADCARAAEFGSNPFRFTHILNVSDKLVVRPPNGCTNDAIVTQMVSIDDNGDDDIFDETLSEGGIWRQCRRFNAVDDILDETVSREEGIWRRCRRFLEIAFHEDDSRILLHCAKGVNRSPTITIAWLMHTLQWTYFDALTYVRKRRPSTRLHPNYAMQLKVFEKQCAGISRVTQPRPYPCSSCVLQ